MTTTSSEVFSESDRLLGEVICDYLNAVEAGQAPNRQALLAQNAVIAGDLAAFFTDRDRLERLAMPLREATHATAAATLPGSRVGGYEILEEIGRGGMGAVFAARQDRPRRVVALKMILAGVWAGQEQLERFQAESDLLAQLKHSNIVRVHEVGEHEGRPYFTMDFAEGGSLAHKLAVAPLLPRQVAELLRTLARAVHGAHMQGIVHRDLKPSNVLLAGDQTPLIGDFGLAKQLTGEPGQETAADWTQTGAILGTPSYMAPEQAAGQSKDIGPAADVYSLGAILYECVTGRPPFKAATVAQTLDQIRTQDPVPPGRLQTTLPRDLETICLKCLEKDPQRRYASAKALAEDLDHWLAGEPIEARRVGRAERLWRWCRRQPAAAALVALSLASGTALPVGLLIHNARLQGAVDQADHNLNEARLQHELADARYHAARDSMQQMVDRLSNQRLADVPRLRELRQELLEDSLKFYQATLAQADNPDPAVRKDTAFAYLETGAIQVRLRRPGPAKENLRRAIQLLEDLPAEDRTRPELLMKLATCHNYLGYIAVNSQQWEECESHFRALLAIAERLAAEQPNNLEWLGEQARAEHGLGMLYQYRGRLPEAVGHYDRSVAWLTKVVNAHPQVEDYQERLAATLNNLSEILAWQNRVKQARAANAKATALLEPLHRRDPQEPRYALALAAVYSNEGWFLCTEGNVKEAEKWMTRSVELADAVLRLEPQLGEARGRVRIVFIRRAQLHEKMGRWAEAVKDRDRAILFNEKSCPWEDRVRLALALARAKNHARAVAETHAVETDPRLSPDGVLTLANACYLSVEPARNDTKLLQAERDALAERYAARAVALLQRLRQMGYFKDPSNAVNLVAGSDYASLRGRADFKQLRKDVLKGIFGSRERPNPDPPRKKE